MIILEWGGYSSNYIIQWLFHNFDIFWGMCDVPNKNLVALLGVMWIYFQILQFVKHSGRECELPKKSVKLVLSDLQITGTIIALAGCSFGMSHHQSLVFIPLYLQQLCELVR
jgi:hypothetical protein